MKQKPGEVMSYLAHAHPFLDGNGRTILTVHTELAQRAGFSIDWAAIKKHDYLKYLTDDLLKPDAGILDAYLVKFIRSPVSKNVLAEHVIKTQGLDGGDYFPEVEYAQYSKADAKKKQRQLIRCQKKCSSKT